MSDNARDPQALLPPNVRDIIEGYALILKPISRSEINEQYVFWLNDPQTNAFLEARHQAQTEASIIEYVNKLRSIKGGELLAIFTKNGNKHIGNTAIKKYNPNGLASYGLMIGDARAQQFGAGGEATVLLLEYFFRHPEIRKVHGGVISANKRAWENLESVGFSREGELREQALLSSGEVSDVYVYGMLRREWETHRLRAMNILNKIVVSRLSVESK